MPWNAALRWGEQWGQGDYGLAWGSQDGSWAIALDLGSQGERVLGELNGIAQGQGLDQDSLSWQGHPVTAWTRLAPQGTPPTLSLQVTAVHTLVSAHPGDPPTTLIVASSLETLAEILAQVDGGDRLWGEASYGLWRDPWGVGHLGSVLPGLRWLQWLGGDWLQGIGEIQWQGGGQAQEGTDWSRWVQVTLGQKD